MATLARSRSAAPRRAERAGVHIQVADLAYLLVGTGFGLVLVKAEVVSWYRIQEMFRFHSFHMYGVIGSAVAVAMLSLWLLRRFGVRAANGEKIAMAPKAPTYRRYVLGGIVFGLGWALAGACPGPIFALIGTGATALVAVLASAVVGTWIYGLVKDRIPH
jgi:uncharacterized membrane protein YedE/YeeE